MNQKFTKFSRLLNSKHYEIVFKKPDVRVSNKFFFILVRKNQLKTARIGVIVSKKNVPKAVQRNRIKRHIRENFRIDKINDIAIDLVVLAKKNTHLLSNIEIKNELLVLFRDLENKAN